MKFLYSDNLEAFIWADQLISQGIKILKNSVLWFKELI